MTRPARLLTMAPSHYSEKARWALDLVGMAYREECLAPGLHFGALKRAGGKSCPTLIVPGGPLLKDSTDILRFLDQQHPELGLWPREPGLGAEVDAWEEEFDEVMAPRVRNWMYCWGITTRRMAMKIFGRRLTFGHRLFLFSIAGQLSSQIPRKFKLRRKTPDEHLALLREVWDKVDAKLADGRKFLVGDRFSAADLALASIGAHIVDPPEFGGGTLPMAERPEAARVICEAFRASPAGQHILRVYREQRMPRGAQVSAAA